VPPGCAHGYQTLEPDTELLYLTSHRYARDAATGVRFDDPAFGIDWPHPLGPISDGDRSWDLWSEDDLRSKGIDE
jgi:dTDP-4-dehydrorhamnose 3,5-epimerase